MHATRLVTDRARSPNHAHEQQAVCRCFFFVSLFLRSFSFRNAHPTHRAIRDKDSYCSIVAVSWCVKNPSFSVALTCRRIIDCASKRTRKISVSTVVTGKHDSVRTTLASKRKPFPLAAVARSRPLCVALQRRFCTLLGFRCRRHCLAAASHSQPSFLPSRNVDGQLKRPQSVLPISFVECDEEAVSAPPSTIRKTTETKKREICPPIRKDKILHFSFEFPAGQQKCRRRAHFSVVCTLYVVACARVSKLKW